jgi:hypothetical protein
MLTSRFTLRLSRFTQLIIMVSVIAASGATLSACGTAPRGTVTGILKEVGGPLPGTRDITGRVTLTGSNGESYSSRANSKGRFSLAVPAGTYSASADSPYLHISTGACPTVSHITVHQSSSTRITIACLVH